MGRKPRWRTISTPHHILKPFWPLLSYIDTLETVSKIIPGRLYTKSASTHIPTFHLSTYSISGPKYLMKYQSIVQELFIVCANQERYNLINIISTHIQSTYKPNTLLYSTSLS